MIRQFLSAAVLLSLVPLSAKADIVYNSWATNEGDTGNYILAVSDAGSGSFDFNLTVNPWNAEALGLFVDLGDNDVGTLSITGVSTSPNNGGVALFATDTASGDCGSGCNLQGLNPPVANPDGQWEMVFRLADNGYNGIQTFAWTVNGLNDVSLNDFGFVGIRAQNLCDPGQLLPGGSCDGSDKSYGSSSVPDVNVPLPAAAWLFGSALLGLAGIARRKQSL